MEFFSKIYCINLESATDRWEAANNQFEELGIPVERYPVKRDSNPTKGLSKTNRKIVKHAMKSDWDNVLIFEDDIKFVNDIGILEKAISQLPDNWEIFYLGCGLKDSPEQYSSHLVKINRAMCVHAVCYSKRIYKKMLKMKGVVDVYIADQIQPRGRCFCVNPILATQGTANSIRTGKRIRKDIILSKWNKKTKNV